jgi:hypothetical protein
MADTPLEPYEDAPIQSDAEGAAPARRRLRWLLPVGIAAVIALVAVGIVLASRDEEPTPVELLSAAPAAAREAKTALITMKATAGGQGQSMSFDGTGAIDFVTGNQSMEMSLLGTKLEIRMIDGTMFMHLPDVGRPPGFTQSWISVPMPKGAEANQLQLGADGAGMLDGLAGVSADGIEELGADTIDGEDVDGYKVTIDLDKAIERLPEDEQDDLAFARDQMAAMGLDEWPMEVWLTQDGLPARITMTMQSSGVDVDVRMDFSDYGTDVDLAEPDPADTRAYDSLTEMQQDLGAVGAGDSGH